MTRVVLPDEADALAPAEELFHHLLVAAPCGASWDEMAGDNLVRCCRHCRQNVYNLSGMSAPEAAAFVRETECRLGIRFYRRHDGTVLARDCPWGRRSVRRWLIRMGSVVAGSGIAGSLAGLLFTLSGAPHPGLLVHASATVGALGGGMLGAQAGCLLAVLISLANSPRRPEEPRIARIAHDPCRKRPPR